MSSIKETFHKFEKDLPWLILVLCGLLFSYHFLDRYDLPLNDEAGYARGTYWYHRGWAPLYQLLYYLLNSVTHSRTDSFEFILFLLSFIIVPLVTYCFCLRVFSNRTTSVVVAFCSLVAPWNFPSEPKVQVANFCLLLLIMLLRWSRLAPDRKFLFFYVLMCSSIYLRQDNIIILLSFLVYDFVCVYKERKWRSMAFIFLGLGLSSAVLWLVFKQPFDARRTWVTFLDHFRWRNESLLESVLTGKAHYKELMEAHFGGAHSILGAFWARPNEVINHMLRNAVDLVSGLIVNFKLLLTLPFGVMWILLGLGSFVGYGKNSFSNGPIKGDLIVLGGGITFKCVLIALLLQPDGKYLFELSFFAMIIFFYAIQKIKTRFPIGPYLPCVYLLLPLLLIFHNFDTHLFTNRFNVRKTVSVLKPLMPPEPMDSMVSSFGLTVWISGHKTYPLILMREFDDLIKRDFATFIKQENVHIIVMDPAFRRNLLAVGLRHSMDHFEKNFSEFGFSKVYEDATEEVVIYKLSDTSLNH